MKTILYIFFLIFSTQAKAQLVDSVYVSENNSLALQGISSQPIDESLVIPNTINRISSDENGNFVITTTNESQVILYDIDGNQVRILGNIGRGPFEFVKSSTIHIKDGKITLWDHGQLKFVQFDIDGNPLLEITDFRYNIRDFAVVDENIFIYNSGNFDGPIVEKYSIKNNRFEEQWGEPSEEHKVLMLQSKAGDLLYHKNHIYFVSPASLEINKIDLDTGEMISKSISDSDFQVSDVRNARELISDETGKLNELLNNSSFVRNLLLTNKYLIIVAETGYYTESIWSGLDASNRLLKLYVLDILTLDLIDTFSLPMTLEGTWHAILDEPILISSLNLWNADPIGAMNQTSQFRHNWKIRPYKK